MVKRYLIAFFLLFIFVSLVQGQSAQNSANPSTAQVVIYPNTPDGLQKQIDDILRAAKDKNSAKETELIRALLLPKNSTWFIDKYGPGFGTRLAANYEKDLPGMEEGIKAIYEGNVERGWTTPKLIRYDNPDAVDSPTDHFLNCMNKIVPLYQTAFHDGRPMFYMPIRPAGNTKGAAGDLDGFFIYDQGGFRFVPMDVLIKLPSERPVRIKLDTNIMSSKLQTESNLRYPEEAIRKHISGTVVVHLVIGTTGNIKEMKVTQGDPALSVPVVADMKNWHFEPTTLDGDPVEVEVDWSSGFEGHFN
jgi:TonB family protein